MNLERLERRCPELGQHGIESVDVWLQEIRSVIETIPTEDERVSEKVQMLRDLIEQLGEILKEYRELDQSRERAFACRVTGMHKIGHIFSCENKRGENIFVFLALVAFVGGVVLALGSAATVGHSMHALVHGDRTGSGHTGEWGIQTAIFGVAAALVAIQSNREGKYKGTRRDLQTLLRHLTMLFERAREEIANLRALLEENVQSRFGEVIQGPLSAMEREIAIFRQVGNAYLHKIGKKCYFSQFAFPEGQLGGDLSVRERHYQELKGSQIIVRGYKEFLRKRGWFFTITFAGLGPVVLGLGAILSFDGAVEIFRITVDQLTEEGTLFDDAGHSIEWVGNGVTFIGMGGGILQHIYNLGAAYHIRQIEAEEARENVSEVTLTTIPSREDLP